MDAVFKVCCMKLNPSVTVAQDELLTKSPAVYPHWRSDIKTFSVAQGSYTFSVDDIFHGLVPARLFLAIVSSSAYAGNLKKNPFNFQHFFLNYLELAVDGQSVPSVPFQPHYQTNPADTDKVLPTGYVHEFVSAFKSKYPQAEGNWITRSGASSVAMRSLRLRITSSNLRICRSKYIRSLLCKIITQSCQNSHCFKLDISLQNAAYHFNVEDV